MDINRERAIKLLREHPMIFAKLLVECYYDHPLPDEYKDIRLEIMEVYGGVDFVLNINTETSERAVTVEYDYSMVETSKAPIMFGFKVRHWFHGMGHFPHRRGTCSYKIELSLVAQKDHMLQFNFDVCPLATELLALINKEASDV